MKLPMYESKNQICYRFNDYKVNIELLKRVVGKFLTDYFTLAIALMTEDWDLVILQQCEQGPQLKERQIFRQHKTLLTTFYPIGLNEK